MNPPPRHDPQQEAVYAAEAVLTPVARRFSSIDEARAFAAAVFDDDVLWDVVEPVDDPHLAIEHRFRRWAAVTDGRTVRLSPRTGLDAATVLHELAHVLTPGQEHHPPFCGMFAWLVRRHLGVYALADLERSFATHGVLATPPPGQVRPGEGLRWAALRRGAGRATP